MSTGRAERDGREMAPVPAIATFREGSLHRALKDLYARSVADARVEALVDGFVVDVAGRDELVEIQTTGFAGARRKLERLVERHRLTLVHPIPVDKWLLVVDGDGVVVRRRRSPRHGRPLDLFDELVHIPSVLAHPNLRIEILLTREEEIRGPVPAGARYRYPREWWRLDRRLIEVVETLRIERPTDLLSILPPEIAEPFTTADLVAASGCSRRLAMRAAYCLERSGASRRVGRRGRHVLFSREHGEAAALETVSEDAPRSSIGPELESVPDRLAG